MDYSFTEEEAQAAHDEWGCNCGPAALAFALQADLSAVRHAIPGFDDKRYTSPTMMKAALAYLGRAYEVRPVSRAGMFDIDRVTLVRVQWTGPWTAPGANPRWAYGATHWIAAYLHFGHRLVFDINGGISFFEDWDSKIAPVLAALHKRADGRWLPTHCWALSGKAAQ